MQVLHRRALRTLIPVFEKMSKRLPHDDQTEFSVWNKKRSVQPGIQRKVLVAHTDPSIGESIVLMLGLRGNSSMYAPDLESLHLQLDFWDPSVVFIDTRFENKIDYAFTLAMRSDPQYSARLWIAMRDIAKEESAETLKNMGFDGLCRRPCPVWKLYEILNDFYAPIAK
ncbi:hypothetical protein ASG35_11310 [Burkholderia sp. Leaf177]|nr:hypothetical protein ASG35_11310 [Burkholderia sp. Leaf177]